MTNQVDQGGIADLEMTLGGFVSLPPRQRARESSRRASGFW